MSVQLPILTVSELNRQVKNFLENEVGMIQVEGEVSNLSKPYSGHFYFTLKDNNAQIRCVFFKNRHVGDVARTLADGQHLIASGRLSLYEARGDYQLIVEQVTNAGLGALYQRFEELKAKLAAEGLFDSIRKKMLPLFPTTIGIISSPSGAALQDILSTLARRYPLASLVVYASEVQGVNAPKQLIAALVKANLEKRCDVIILARGGGSIEDLWAFNDEQLARQIAKSLIPIIAGIGHETDFTIADFVADCRAETPTAAATIATPDSVELHNLLNKALTRLQLAITGILQKYKITLTHLNEKLSSPEQAISSYWQRLDYLEKQLSLCFKQSIQHKKHRLQLSLANLAHQSPASQIGRTRIHLEQLNSILAQHMRDKLQKLSHQFNKNLATLHAVSPLATLDRGYAIASKNNHVLHSATAVNIGDRIQVRLAKGELACEVLTIENL